MDGRSLELEEHAVAQRDRVGEILEPDAVLGEARDGERSCVAPRATTRRS